MQLNDSRQRFAKQVFSADISEIFKFHQFVCFSFSHFFHSFCFLVSRFWSYSFFRTWLFFNWQIVCFLGTKMIYISIYVGRRRHKNEIKFIQLQLTQRTHLPSNVSCSTKRASQEKVKSHRQQFNWPSCRVNLLQTLKGMLPELTRAVRCLKKAYRDNKRLKNL